MSELRAEFERDPQRFLRRAISEYVANDPGNRLVHFGNEPVFGEPLVGFADGDDLLFQEYKTIIGDYHLTPREVMQVHCQLPSSEPVSVIAVVLPITSILTAEHVALSE
ncbi:MAG: hypothetical protein HYX90_11600 [Chloroflexi bacterium]|nr:hypothetical protein [Chloroflexota bacterium]